ncbi:MAG: glycosyltransferase family A protein [Salinibacter sp.]
MSLQFTALIRTYNSAQTLGACLTSLSAQTLSPERAIVVDSGSTDETLDIAREYGADIVKYPDGEEFNYSRAINIGMEHVETSHALIISSHVSLPDPNSIRVLARLLKEDERRCAASITGTVESVVDADVGEVEWTLVTRENFIPRYEGIGISNSCNLIPTELWRRCAFDESIPKCEDQKWLLHYLKCDWNAARVKHPQTVYQNPYYSVRKEVGDVFAIAMYDINPTLTEWSSILGRVQNCFSAIGKGDLDQALHSARIVRGLLRIRMGFEEKVKSKYF